jgi:hypothetical protein
MRMRLLPGLMISASSTTSLGSTVQRPRLFCGRARGRPQRRADRGTQGAIQVSGWPGGLLGIGDQRWASAPRPLALASPGRRVPTSGQTRKTGADSEGPLEANLRGT